MIIFNCGDFTYGNKKPCKHCEHFIHWGVGGGSCELKTNNWDEYADYVSTYNHCKYYKRDRYMYSKDGICKHPELEYL